MRMVPAVSSRSDGSIQERQHRATRPPTVAVAGTARSLGTKQMNTTGICAVWALVASNLANRRSITFMPRLLDEEGPSQWRSPSFGAPMGGVGVRLRDRGEHAEVDTTGVRRAAPGWSADARAGGSLTPPASTRRGIAPSVATGRQQPGALAWLVIEPGYRSAFIVVQVIGTGVPIHN
jgi:hypothetical protein